jgi:hypothetical protein
MIQHGCFPADKTWGIEVTINFKCRNKNTGEEFPVVYQSLMAELPIDLINKIKSYNLYENVQWNENELSPTDLEAC